MLKTNARHVFAGVLLLLMILFLTGCGTKDESGKSTPQPAPQPAPPQPAPTPVAVTAPAGTLASTEGEYPGIKVAVQELKRGPNTLTLKFAAINATSQVFGFSYALSEGLSTLDISGIHLIDAANKKKYFVVHDSDQTPLCSRDIAPIAAGSQSVLWAKFPAPPDDVQKITVEIPHFPPLEDVPISR